MTESRSDRPVRRDEFIARDGVKIFTDGADIPPAAGTFAEMGLSTMMHAHLDALNFSAPMPIQSHAIPIAMKGFDIIGCAQTGTGKSAAFFIPIIERIKHTPPPRVKQDHGPAVPRVLVLAPTRELAMQLEDHLEKLTRRWPVSSVVLVGGKRYREQLVALRRGVTVVIATPGRLLDHMDSNRLTLLGVEILVLDEADRMFDMGFAPQIRRILQRAPARDHRQTMLFSATMPRELTRLAEEHLLDPIRIEVSPPNTTAANVRHDVKIMGGGSKINFLLDLLDDHIRDGGGRVIIFTRRKVDADRLSSQLTKNSIDCVTMHADRTQIQREKALERFRDGKVEVLVATDLASRGLDVENIVRVINFDFPQTVDDYIHRVGRTARAGAKGHATSIVEPGDLPLMLEVEAALHQKLPRFGAMPDMSVAPMATTSASASADSSAGSSTGSSVRRGLPIAPPTNISRRPRR